MGGTALLRQIQSPTMTSNNEIMDITVSEPEPTQLYQSTHTGPFCFMITGRNSIASLHPLSLCKMVHGLPSSTSIQRAGRNAIKISFQSFEQASLAVQQVNSRKDLRAFIPQSLLYCFGIISGIPPEFSEQELFENINSDIPLASVRRITRFTNGISTPTFSV